jgi:hypothetical protein
MAHLGARLDFPPGAQYCKHVFEAPAIANVGTAGELDAEGWDRENGTLKGHGQVVQ